jgi:hypothetical protein
MRYLKDSKDGFYAVDDDVQPSKYWVEISEAEWLAHNPQVLPSDAAIIEAKKQTVRALREQVIDRLMGIAGRASRKGNTALAEACDTAAEALLDITQDLPTDPEAVEQTLVGRYLLIRDAAIQGAPSLELAFAQVDA